jgi:D-hydroxyproline dehydrogenase subunit alpha
MPVTVMQTDVVVVGGGPAGMAAATAAAETGATVVLLDEYAEPGGQFFKRATSGLSVPPDRLTREHSRGEALRNKLDHPNVQVLTRALAWGRFDDCIKLVHEGQSKTVRSKALVIATGAYDRPVAFPGWTLPGVMSAGGAQTLAKSQWVKPGGRMLLAGAGPFLLPVAQSLLRADVQIVALVEATRPLEWLPHAGSLWGQWPRFAEAWDYKRTLQRAGVPTLYGRKIVRVLGSEHVEGAVIATVDREWRAVPGTEHTFEVDAVATGYGFLPNIELAASCRCELRFDSFARAWFVRCNEAMETNIPGIFVAGEITGIGGSALALAEGEIAGVSAAEFVGVLSPRDAEERRRGAAAQRPHLDRFADVLNRLFGPRPGLWEYLNERMTVCRCEEVTASEIEACVSEGASSVKAVKDCTRAGMGLCQGRICRAMVSEIVARWRAVELATIPFPSVRPPIKPVPIAALLQDESVAS